jgi:hypothetical protein
MIPLLYTLAVEKSIRGAGVKVAVGGGKGVPVGRGKAVAVAGRAVGGAGVRVGLLRKAAELDVGVAVAAGVQALNKNTRQIIKMVSEECFLLFIAIPVIYKFPLITSLIFFLALQKFTEFVTPIIHRFTRNVQERNQGFMV